MEFKNSFSEIANLYDALIFDVYGVFWDGKSIIPGTIEAMKRVKSEGKIVGILSNVTLLSEEVKASYQNRGLLCGEHYDFFVTSGDVAREMVQEQKLDFPVVSKTYQGFPHGNPRLFAETGFEETSDIRLADFIYVGVPTDQRGNRIAPDDIAIFQDDLSIFRNLNKTLFCANPDQAAQDGKTLVMTQGRIGTEYERMGGKVQWCGKPYPEVFEYTLKKLSQYQIREKERIAMIGDTLETDILGARNAGIKSVLVTDTGALYPKLCDGRTLQDLCLDAKVTPDYVISGINC